MITVSGFVVGFERTGYTVEEGSGVVSVCLQVEFRNVFEQTQASVVVSTNNETATSEWRERPLYTAYECVELL